jgi:hypothetical protein
MKKRKIDVNTPIGKVIIVQIGGEQSNEEIQKALDNYEKAYADLEAKHEEVTMLKEDDKQFEEEEQWIEQCQETFLRLEIEAQDYMKKHTITDKKEKNMETEVISTPAENRPNLVQVNENDISAASEGNQDNSVITTAPISTQELQDDNGQPSSSTND